MPPITLILGGIRSGKTAYAEQLILRAGGGLYIATGQAQDAEMASRIARHQRLRPACLDTVEAPLDLVAALQGHAGRGRPLLVDCLGMWLCNVMMAERDVTQEADRLIDALDKGLPAPVLFVASETGLGLVPDNRLARAFCDHIGLLNQRLAARADHVLLIMAGLPLTLKSPLTESHAP